ncbi:PEP-CTERM sorting domain-containing protein [Kiritimatiella glycovorans]|uniref:PEP-CTERM protein-sorting domain-containing protein n=1 Tax=Kiritimatiella glycovorans TaxID=1307763 RepID=A0A0G3EGJ7_9BACT|nr:PEP-CTERM sorting domain-containing protein [Kiritimatiella glycovorans]AKJ63910.1 hypothetical protein L21SP4_00641 [Kiritimatiella glycovorans]
MRKLCMALAAVLVGTLVADAQTEWWFENDFAAGYGRLENGWNWTNNANPYLSSNRVGILTGNEPNMAGTNYWTPKALDDFWIEQRGGTLMDYGEDLSIRKDTVYTLNDTGNDGSYTNIIVRDYKLNLWTWGGTNLLNLYAGNVYADKTFGNASDTQLTLSNAVVNIMSNNINANCGLTLLSGGTGVWHQVRAKSIPTMAFEDPDGDPTIGDNHFMGSIVWETNGASAMTPAVWKYYLGNGITYDGKAMQTTNASQDDYYANYFVISDDNTTLTVIPEPTTFGLLGFIGLTLAALRRKLHR